MSHYYYNDGRGNTFALDGFTGQTIPCRFPDESQTEVFPTGRKIKKYPVVDYEPKNLNQVCKLTDKVVPEGTSTMSVPKGDCEVQRELGMCPRGLDEMGRRK